MRLTVESRIEATPRVQQVRGLFDLRDDNFSRVTWDFSVDLNFPWQLGLITGPSGSGKSTIARELFQANSLWGDKLTPWPADLAVVDGFPNEMSVRDVTALLSAVGFSSPPAWLRPYRVLSTGQQFRCDLARLLAFAGDAATNRDTVTAYTEEPPIAVMDEFTSVVGRTVAKIGSAALAKTARHRGLRFVAVSCHDDIIDWLQPDWILTPADGVLTRRSLQRRPTLELEIVRTTTSAWPHFAPHHYLSHTISNACTCFLAVHESRPVAFSAWINQMSHLGGKREHRTVVLPDYQGIGVGMAISDTIASMWKALGHRATSTTTHPAFIAARKRSKYWTMSRPPSLAGQARRNLSKQREMKHATTRLTAGFTYVGPAMDFAKAQQLIA